MRDLHTGSAICSVSKQRCADMSLRKCVCVVITLWMLLCARAEDAHNTSRTQPEQDNIKAGFLKRVSSPQPYIEDALSGHGLYVQWAGQRIRHTALQMAVKTYSAFGVSFLKCAQLDAGGDLSVTLLVSNPEEGHDLSQLCIRDSVSELTLLHTHSHTHLRESGYQTFSSDTLTAGSQFVVLYRMSVKANTNQALNLPAFLTFSNATQNDIHLFGPVKANFTLMVHTTGQPGVRVYLLFLLFLLLTLAAVVLFCRRMRRRAAPVRSSADEEAEGGSDITASANEEAEFEDKFVDIVLLEDPQNMNQALDSVVWSCVCRAARAQECVRVQLFRALLCVLLSAARAEGRLSGGSERRLLGVLRGQMEAVEGKVEEQRAERVEELMEQCKTETQEEMEDLQRTHLREEEQAEELIQHCTTQEAQEVRAQLEELQRVEQERLRRCLRLQHQHASAQTLRLQALQRRHELHRIWVEELEEARRSGEMEESTAHLLLLQYYTCQDTLEEVLDVLLANQRAQLAERHAHRHFLLQSLQSLQSVTSDAFSSSATHTRALRTHTHGVPQQCSDVHLEILRIKQDLEECVKRERRAIRCDIIKRRRQILSEKVCEHRRQQQVFSSSSQLSLQQFLHEYTDLLIHHSNERSQLITQLDEETVARARKLSLCALQRAVVQLKACVSAVCPAAVCVLPQVQLMQECVQCVCEAAAREHQCAVSRIRLQHQQELQQQRSSRRAFAEYCSCLCVCVPSLSPKQRLRLHLECVKAACRLDRCLALHHTISESSWQQHAPDPSAPAETPAGAGTGFSSVQEGAPEVTELQVFKRRIQERLRHSGGQSGTLQQEASELQQQQQRVCEEHLAVCVSALQWEQAEATARLTETHSTLLKLQTLLTAHTQDTALTHTLHTHRQALEEAELRLQQEEVQWAETAEGQGCCDEEVEQEGVFMVNGDSSVSALLQEALWKRQQVQRWTHRNQTLEHQEQQLQVNRLQVYCEQDLAFTAALVRQSLISVPDLHEVLRLLLPTGPEGELLSLIDALGPRAGEASGHHRALAHTLKLDVLSRTAGHAQRTHRETQRLIKKRQQCLDALLSANTPEDQQRRRRRRTREQPEAELMGTHDNEGAWPMGVAQGSVDSMGDGNEGVEPVGVPQGSIDSMRNGNEGAWPVGVAQSSIDSSERLFVFRCAPPTVQQHTHTHTSHTRKKKRSFLNFKKSSVAPQPHT